MSRFKEVWEYKSITEVIQKLGRLDEERRYMAIGAGVVLGSKQAYDKQPHYYADQIRDQAEEAGLIAEKIEELSANQAVPKALKEIASLEGKSEKSSWSRPYFILRETQPYDAEKLAALGAYLEKRVLSLGSQERLKKFRTRLKHKNKDLEYQICRSNWLMEEKCQLTGYLIDLFGREHY